MFGKYDILYDIRKEILVMPHSSGGGSHSGGSHSSHSSHSGGSHGGVVQIINQNR